MGFFDESLDVAKELLGTAAQKTSETVEIQKLNLAICKKRAALNRCYCALGKIFFENKDSRVDIVEQTELLCDEIKTFIGEIDELKAELAIVKNYIICSDCGKKNPKKSAFCNACGKKLY